MKDYIDKFKELVTDSEYVENALGERLYLADRDFKQCYKAGDTVREQLPMFWFCDTDGNVISLGNNKVVWLIPEKNDGRFTYHFRTEENGVFRGKVIRRSSLCGIVWGSYCYGKAADILSDDGIYGFGTNNKEKLTVSCHHIDGDKTNDNYNNLEFATNRVHLQTIHKMPDPADPDNQMGFMQRLTKAAAEEEPNKITILYADDSKKAIDAVDISELPENIKKAVSDFTAKAEIAEVVNNILRQQGKEFFENPRVLFLESARLFLKVHFQKTHSRLAVSLVPATDVFNGELITIKKERG